MVFLLTLGMAAQAQNGDDDLSPEFDFGVGLGLDDGGLGLRFTGQPGDTIKNLRLFGRYLGQ